MAAAVRSLGQSERVPAMRLAGRAVQVEAQRRLRAVVTQRVRAAGPDADILLWPTASRDPADVQLRATCRTNFRFFCQTFFPDTCRLPFNPLHDAIFARRDERITHQIRGWRDVTAAPRGSGKTAVKEIEVVHDMLYRIERYIGVGSANFTHARDKVKAIRDIFTDNAEILRVYGPQETGLLHAPGRWAEHDFITRTGCRVRAFTPKMKTRGFLWENHRLTKALFDDLEDQEMVLTPLRRDRLLSWFQSDIAKLGESDLNMDGIGTILHPDSLLASLLKNPGYRGNIYRAVLSFADGDAAWALWGEWRSMVLNLANPQRLADAHAFYLQHEAAMLHGVEVLWPEMHSYEFLMLDRVIYGEQAFWTERQNDPRSDVRFLFDMAAAAYCTVRDDAVVTHAGRLAHFLDMTNLAAYWDPTPDRQQAEGCYACCVIAMKDRFGYCYLVDAYCEQEPSTDAQMNAIAALLYKWQVPQLGVEVNGFQSLLPGELRRKLTALAQQHGAPWDLSFVPIKNVKNKLLRISSLDALVSNHWLLFADTLPPAFVQQFRDFVPQEGVSKYLDAPDSTEGVLRVLGGLYDRRAAF